jgi:hypothetical protein
MRASDDMTSSGQRSERRVLIRPANETTGASLPSWYPPPRDVAHITAAARRLAVSLESKEMASALGRVAQAVSGLAEALSEQGMDVSSLPPMNAVLVEDGSALLEWMLPSMRIGFAIDSSASESSWFLVSREDQNSASGVLNEAGQDILIRTLLSILSANS